MEVEEVKKKINQYKEYDRFDLIMELSFTKEKLKKLKKRKIKKFIKSDELKTEALPEEVKYCTGDSCQTNL